jgi:hypothetical protein
VTFYDPKTGIELNADMSDLQQINSIVAMIYQRSLCNREQDGYGCCLGVHIKQFKTSLCVKLVKGNPNKVEVTVNGKAVFSHDAKGKHFYSCFSFLYT